MSLETRPEPFLYPWVVGVCHAKMSFDTRCPGLHRRSCFRAERPIGRGWDSHSLKIAEFTATGTKSKSRSSKSKRSARSRTRSTRRRILCPTTRRNQTELTKQREKLQKEVDNAAKN